MDTAAMKSALKGSESGKLRFPDVIGILSGAGVESYYADLIRGEDVFYMPDGQTHVEPMQHSGWKVAGSFSQEALIKALRLVQADEIRYPEFLKQATSAGTAGYRVFLTGRKVIYFGRKGEFHVENFPGTK